MKFKYACHNCGQENTVAVSDMINMGMGFGGAMADEMGFGNMMFGGGSFGGGNMPSRNLPAEIAHKCQKCNETNVIPIRR